MGVSQGCHVRGEFGQHDGVVDAQVLAGRATRPAEVVEVRNVVDLIGALVCPPRPRGTFDPMRLTAMISPRRAPAHFAVAAIKTHLWCPDTPDADRHAWRETKDSIVLSLTGFCPSRRLVCPSGEHGRGAEGEQTYAPNSPERTSTALNGPALTCGIPISTGQRDMPNIVHTYGLFQLRSTDLNYTKPQVNRR